MPSTTTRVEDRVRAEFEREAAEHQMEVILDQGIHRHLRFQRPGTSAYHFDLVTWPGYLAISGDMGEYVFRRIRDMFEFFKGDGINPHYWSEKLRAPRHDAVRVYSLDQFDASVREWQEDLIESFEWEGEQADRFRMAVKDGLLDAAPLSRDDAVRQLLDFSYRWGPQNGVVVSSGVRAERTIRIEEPWEWNLTEWEHQFIWCCWAIRWGIGVYRAAQPVEEAASVA